MLRLPGVAVLGLVGCATVALETTSDTPPAPPHEELRVSKEDAEPDCDVLGPVAEAIWQGDLDGARLKLRAKASKMGANYLQLECPTAGTAYRCPK